MNQPKHRLRSATTLTAALLLLPLAGAQALKPVEKTAPQALVQQILPDDAEPSYLWGEQRISLETGLPLALWHMDYPVRGENAEEKARHFLGVHSRVLGLEQGDLGDLRSHFVRSSRGGETVRFHQYIGPVRVYDAELAVTMNRQDEVVFVTNSYKAGADLPSLVPALTAQEALEAAAGAVGVDGPLEFERTELVVYHAHGASRLAWEVRMEPRLSPLGHWEVLVDANHGEIFKLVDRAAYVDGTGSVFNPDPLSTALATYGQTGYTDGNDADTAQLVAEIETQPLRDITFSGGLHQLIGPWAEIQDFESPFKGLFSQASSNFAFTRSPDGFEAAHTYYHIDTYMRYMNNTLGLDVQPYQYATGVRFDPHGLNGSDNSHYLTGSGRLAFGEGGVDDAEDADVVIHELGHGIHDWVTGGGLSQVNGLSEGLGDYFAASYSRFLGRWSPGDAAYHFVFSWDGHNPFWPGRVSNYGPLYPGGLTGQIHTDGQIWSTCNMKVWDLNGREFTDAAVIEGIAMTNSSTNQQTAAQAVVQAAVNLKFPYRVVQNFLDVYQTCVYTITPPTPPVLFFGSGFESGNTAQWTLSVMEP